jgi:hypothetical protein
VNAVRKIFVILVCVCLTAFAFTCIWAETESWAAQPTLSSSLEWKESDGGTQRLHGFILPEFLEVIEEEAFEGTTPDYAQFPEKLLRVESRAFAGIPSLTYIFVSSNMRYMADNAFSGNTGLMVVGEKASYAEKWARAHGYGFAESAVFFSGQFEETFGRKASEQRSVTQWLAFALIAALFILNKRKPHFRRIWEGKTMRPQERAELHDIAYSFP